MVATYFEEVQRGLLSTARKQAVRYGDAVAGELWPHGFLPDKSRLYAIDRYGHDAYLSDLQRRMTRPINGPYRELLRNKVVFHEVFRAAVPTVPIIGYTDERGFAHALPDRGTLFAKPVDGSGGKGAFRARLEDGHAIVEERTLPRATFIDDLFSRNRLYILSQVVRAHPDIEAFFDRTTNTVRVLMMRCPATGEGFIAAAVLRVGTMASGDVDNWSGGGVSFSVDAGSGLIGEGRQKGGRPVYVHPDTAAPITGRLVPMWDEVIDTCRTAFDHCRRLHYVAWDIVVTPSRPVVLEGNGCCDVDLLQVHGPLLVDDRVRAFYAHHGVLDWRPTEAL